MTRPVIALVALVALSPPAAGADERPLALAEVMAIAARRAPAIRSAHDAVTQSELRRDIADAAHGLRVAPLLSLGHDPWGGGERELGVAASRSLATGTDVSVTARSSRFGAAGYGWNEMSVGLSQSLTRAVGPARNFDRWSSAQQVESAGRMLANARQQAAIDAASAFCDIVRQQQLLEASVLAKTRAERMSRAAAARAQAGLATQLDVMRAELLVAQAESGAAAVEEALDGARDRLNALLGREPGTPVSLAAIDPGAIDALIAGLPAALDQQIATALATRVEIVDARARVEQAARAASVARWNLLPDVRVVATYTRRQLAGAPQYDDPFNGWRVGFATSYALDGGAGRSAAALSALSAGAAEQDAADAARRVTAEVRTVSRAVSRAEGTIAIEQRALDIAERQRQLAEMRYERGLADNADVIDAEAGVFRARAAVISAQIDRTLARLRLAAAVGILDPEPRR
jgi:outer membrane protein